MNFVINKNDFPSEVHKAIYKTRLLRTPLETSLSDTSNIDESLIESCKSYFLFTTDLLFDMYENPSEYGLQAGEFEKLIIGHNPNRAIRNGYAKKHFDINVLSNTCKLTDSYKSYFDLLFRLGVDCNINGNDMEISIQNFKNICPGFFSEIKIKKEHAHLIPLHLCLQTLKRQGIDFYINENNVVIKSIKYPNMFLALNKLAKSVKDVKKFGMQNFHTCEFRQIFKKYKPQYEDVVSPLDDEMRKRADEIDRYAKSLKMTRSCENYWGIQYKLKGIKCFDIGTGDINTFRIRILNWDKGNDGSYLLENVKSQDDVFKKYFLRHLNYCTACSSSHIGQIVNIFGSNKRLCGGVPYFGILNPTDADMPYIKKFIDFKYNYIIQKS